MASSLYSSSDIWRYHVFPSFHGPDVRNTFLSLLRKQCSHYGITMFDDQGIERGQTISPEFTQGMIRKSRISIVVLSKNYASSSCRLDELLEILEYSEDNGQIVMTDFYGVDPSDVQKQTGEFGIRFSETCAGKTEEKRRRWSQALTDVGNIAGEHSLDWASESLMIVKIARDISNKLNATISNYFKDIVGIEAHLQKMESLLQLDNEDAVIVGICGPAGIGKTTIARAIHGLLSHRFQLSCFMENLRVSYNSGFDEYGLKLRLQEQLLSKILNHDDMRIYLLGAIPERLSNKKVLIILDNVDDLRQLEALANETTWFGPGSRIIVTTEDQELMGRHGINKIYHVDYPSREEALEILCRYAFRQSYPHNGFQERAESVVDMCGNLPLSLSMVGSSLRGRKVEEWDKVIRRLESCIDHQDIEQVLRVVFEPPSSNKRIRKSNSQCFTVMAFFLVINLLLEIASAVADQLSSIRKPYFARISLVMSILSVFLSIIDLTYKIRDQKARFRCKWPIPWFYYEERGYRRIFGDFTDTVLLSCVVGGLIVSTINYSSIERGREGPINISVWPLFFAIAMVGSKFMEKPVISKDHSL